MSATVTVAWSERSGFTSASASPSTRETWETLFFSARRMAFSSEPSWMARENSGANFRVAAWLFRMSMSFWKATVRLSTDMMKSVMTMPFANQPIVPHRCSRSRLIAFFLSSVGMTTARGRRGRSRVEDHLLTDHDVHRLAAELAGPEDRLGDGFLGGVVEALMGGLDDLDGAR